MSCQEYFNIFTQTALEDSSMNEESSVQRRLVAILAADIAGYIRLMGEDDAAQRENPGASPHAVPHRDQPR